jgi:hypothetical protein
MAIGLVQSKIGGSGSGVSASVTSSAVGYNSITTSGNLLVCVCWSTVVHSSGSGAPAISTPTTSGISWTLLGSAFYNDAADTQGGRVSVYYCENAASLATSTKTTVGANGGTNIVSTDVGFDLYEFSGVKTVSSVDASATSSNQTSGAPGVGNLTTTATDLILVAMNGIANHGAGTNFTLGPGSPLEGQDQYRLNVASGSIATTFSVSDTHWGAVGVAFLPSGTDANASPSGVSATFAENAPTVSAGAGPTPSGVSATFAVNAPTVNADGKPSVSGVSASFAVGTATPVVGAFANPSGVRATFSVGTLTPSGDSSVSTNGVSMTTAVGAAIAATGININGTTVAIGIAYAALAVTVTQKSAALSVSNQGAYSVASIK